MVVKGDISRVFIMQRGDDLVDIRLRWCSIDSIEFGPMCSTIGREVDEAIVCTRPQDIFILLGFR